MSEQNYAVAGEIEHIGREEQITDTFRKRQVVIKTGGDTKYPQLIPIDFVNDKCDALNGYEVGQAVSVTINLRGRQGRDGRYWGSNQGFKIVAESKRDTMDQRPSAEYDDVSQGENGDSDVWPF